MYEASDLRKGLKIELDGEPYIVTEFDFCKPGKGQALYRCRIKHLLNGSTMEKTFRVVDKIGTPDIYQREVIYSYQEGDHYVFSDAKTFEEIRVTAQVLGHSIYFLDDSMPCTIVLYREKPVEVTLPIFVEKKIGFTEPGARGDTATNVTKPATLENGYEFRIPLFVNQGDTVRIDTRTGEYNERVSKA
ncbi:MAG: elongation factor P [Lentisphaerae bacterium RIFOXYB12_FULL_65_16]|nr:MAG: elongation factor P [Lentisphaerae bacterium RIFOXYA12_64_32]OGV86727.1 MAG: elongation factor P [Lentisphaerae bacterium RIFOXYB12_FULL_65_16]